ncbi:MAG: DUF2236 domain-containing protein [Pedobacter sp.]|nr:MAG: DUF2236 domain-containing protein [Pedobacter sp.]
MDDFVKKDSVVKKIWSNTDVILFIFAGAAAEFSLNKAVDWLYFTGKLPKDPLGRLFSTVAYAQKIVFSTTQQANQAIDQITAIHQHVEAARKSKIPDWAYRDVLFMLIDYSIRSFKLLERKLTDLEKEEVFNVFYRVGNRMNIADLPKNYAEWVVMHQTQLHENLIYGPFSKDLYLQYRKHLGFVRFNLMKKIQAILVPKEVNLLLQLGNGKGIATVLSAYKTSRLFKMNELFRNMILPNNYKSQILSLADANKNAF